MVKCHCIFTRPLLFTLSSDPAPGPCSAASKRGFSLPFPASWASPPAQPPDGNQLLARAQHRASQEPPPGNLSNGKLLNCFQSPPVLRKRSQRQSPAQQSPARQSPARQSPAGPAAGGQELPHRPGCSSCSSQLVYSSVSFGPF